MIRWLAAELDRGEGNWGTLLIRLFADNRRCTPPSANSANPPFVRPTELPSLWKGVLKGGSENYSKGPTSRLCTHGYGLERSWERDEGCIVSVPLSETAPPIYICSTLHISRTQNQWMSKKSLQVSRTLHLHICCGDPKDYRWLRNQNVNPADHCRVFPAFWILIQVSWAGSWSLNGLKCCSKSC